MQNFMILIISMAVLAIILIIRFLISGSITPAAVERNKTYFLTKVFGKKTKVDDLLSSKVKEVFETAHVIGKFSLERIRRETDRHYGKLIAKFWNEKTLYSDRGIYYFMQGNTEERLNPNTGFSKSDFEEFVDIAIMDPNLKDNVQSWYKYNEDISTPARALCMMYIFEKSEAGEEIVGFIGREDIRIAMILYCDYKFIEKKIVLPYPA